MIDSRRCDLISKATMPENLYRNINFWDPKLYLEKATPQFQLAALALKKYKFKGNEQILDIGCGPGNITAKLAQKVPQGKVIGIDPAKNMIAFAKDTYSKVKNVSFEDKNVLNFSYSQKFDLITSFSALHWVINQEAALARIYNHLAKHGMLMVVMIPQRKVEPMHDALISLERSEVWQSCFEKFIPPRYLAVSQESYQELLNKIGFQIDYFEAKETLVPFESIDDMAKWFESWSSHRLAVPAQLRRGFFYALSEEYLFLTQQRGTFDYNYATWEFVARISPHHRLFHYLSNKIRA